MNINKLKIIKTQKIIGYHNNRSNETNIFIWGTRFGQTISNYRFIRNNFIKIYKLLKAVYSSAPAIGIFLIFSNYNLERYISESTKKSSIIILRSKMSLMFKKKIDAYYNWFKISSKFAVFIPDIYNNLAILHEAKKSGLPIIGLVNIAKPLLIDYPIYCSNYSLKIIEWYTIYLIKIIQKETNFFQQQKKKYKPKILFDTLKYRKIKPLAYNILSLQKNIKKNWIYMNLYAKTKSFHYSFKSRSDYKTVNRFYWGILRKKYKFFFFDIIGNGRCGYRYMRELRLYKNLIRAYYYNWPHYLRTNFYKRNNLKINWKNKNRSNWISVRPIFKNKQKNKKQNNRWDITPTPFQNKWRNKLNKIQNYLWNINQPTNSQNKWKNRKQSSQLNTKANNFYKKNNFQNKWKGKKSKSYGRRINKKKKHIKTLFFWWKSRLNPYYKFSYAYAFPMLEKKRVSLIKYYLLKRNHLRFLQLQNYIKTLKYEMKKWFRKYKPILRWRWEKLRTIIKKVTLTVQRQKQGKSTHWIPFNNIWGHYKFGINTYFIYAFLNRFQNGAKKNFFSDLDFWNCYYYTPAWIKIQSSTGWVLPPIFIKKYSFFAPKGLCARNDSKLRSTNYQLLWIKNSIFNAKTYWTYINCKLPQRFLNNEKTFQWNKKKKKLPIPITVTLKRRPSMKEIIWQLYYNDQYHVNNFTEQIDVANVADKNEADRMKQALLFFCKNIINEETSSKKTNKKIKNELFHIMRVTKILHEEIINKGNQFNNNMEQAFWFLYQNIRKDDKKFKKPFDTNQIKTAFLLLYNMVINNDDKTEKMDEIDQIERAILHLCKAIILTKGNTPKNMVEEIFLMFSDLIIRERDIVTNKKKTVAEIELLILLFGEAIIEDINKGESINAKEYAFLILFDLVRNKYIKGITGKWSN